MKWMCGALLCAVACTGSGGKADSSSTTEVPDAAMGRDAAVGEDARAHDSGPRGDAGTCEELSTSDRCENDVLVYCRNGGLHREDCAARGFRCAEQTTIGGFWCVQPLGSACDLVDTDFCDVGFTCSDGICVGSHVDGGTGDGSRDANAGDASARDASAPDGGGARG